MCESTRIASRLKRWNASEGNKKSETLLTEWKKFCHVGVQLCGTRERFESFGRSSALPDFRRASKVKPPYGSNLLFVF